MLIGAILETARIKFAPEDLKAMDEILGETDETDENVKKLNAMMLATDISVGQLGAVRQTGKC